MSDQETSKPLLIRTFGLSIYAPTLLMAIGQGSVLAFVVLSARDLGASLGIAGLIFAMRGLGVMVFDIPAGLALARFGPKKAMLISIILTGAFSIVAAFSPNPIVLGLAIFAVGGATSLWMVSGVGLISESAPIDQRGRAMSLIGGSNRIGAFAGPAIGGFAAEGFGLEAALLIQAFGAAAALILVFAFLQEKNRVRDRTVHLPLEVRQTLNEHGRSFLTTGIAMVILQLVRQGRQVILPLWADELGLSPSEIGLVIGFASSLDMLLFYPVGIVMDRFGRKWSAVPSMSLLGVSLLIVPFTDSFETLLLVGLLSGFANGLGSGIMMTVGADLAPRGREGEFLGVWRFITDIGTSGGPFLVAGIATISTLGLASIATGGIGIVGAAVMASLAPETLRRRHPG